MDQWDFFFSEPNSSCPSYLDDITTKEDLLKHIISKYSPDVKNLIYLQGIFKMCEAKNLFEICRRYAKSRKNEKLIFYERAGKTTCYNICYLFI